MWLNQSVLNLENPGLGLTALTATAKAALASWGSCTKWEGGRAQLRGTSKAELGGHRDWEGSRAGAVRCVSLACSVLAGAGHRIVTIIS